MAALSSQALAAFRAQLVASMQERFPDACGKLGRDATEALVEACIATCREFGVPARMAITSAAESLFATEGVDSMSPMDAAHIVRGELEGRRLYSLMETLTGVEVT